MAHLFITSMPDLLNPGPVAAGDVKSLLLEHIFRAVKWIADGRRHDAVELLGQWLAARLPESAATWLANGIDRCRTGTTNRDLYLLISAVSRQVGNAPLALTAQK